MEDCIFCKIVNKDIPSNIIYEDDKIMAFEDVNKMAPVHILIIPKDHIPSINAIDEGNKDIIAHISVNISKLAQKLGIYDTGYRVVINCGKDGGQTVEHLHYHILGKRALTWPPG